MGRVLITIRGQRTGQRHPYIVPSSACETVRHAGTGLHGPCRPSPHRDRTQRGGPFVWSRRRGPSPRRIARGGHGGPGG